MKKLIAVTLTVVIMLTMTAVLAEQNLHITHHYALHMDNYLPQSRTTVGGMIFEDDSFTIDVYLCSDEQTAYYLETSFSSGFIFSTGLMKVRIAERSGEKYLLDESGNGRKIKFGETEDDFMIDFGKGFFKMQLVKPLNANLDR